MFNCSGWRKCNILYFLKTSEKRGQCRSELNVLSVSSKYCNPSNSAWDWSVILGSLWPPCINVKKSSVESSSSLTSVELLSSGDVPKHWRAWGCWGTGSHHVIYNIWRKPPQLEGRMCDGCQCCRPCWVSKRVIVFKKPLIYVCQFELVEIS